MADLTIKECIDCGGLPKLVICVDDRELYIKFYCRSCHYEVEHDCSSDLMDLIGKWNREQARYKAMREGKDELYW